MMNKKELLENIIKKYRSDLDEEYRTILLNRLTSIELSGGEVYELFSHIQNEEEKIFYLGLLIELACKTGAIVLG